MPGRMLTVAEAAKLLGVAPSSLRAWPAEGKVPFTTTPGGHRRFKRSDLTALIDSGMRPGKQAKTTAAMGIQSARDRVWAEVIATAMRAAAADLGEATIEGRRWQSRADDLDRS